MPLFLCAVGPLLCGSAAAFQPYVIGEDGSYAVIEPSSGTVLSTGNFFSELSDDTTVYAQYPFLAKPHFIWRTYMDVPRDRLLLLTVKKYSDPNRNCGDGILVLRMSDRSFIDFIEKRCSGWYYDTVTVTGQNKIVLTNGSEDGADVYDGKTFEKDDKLLTFWDPYPNTGCALPDGKTAYRYGSMLSGKGFYSMGDYELVPGHGMRNRKTGDPVTINGTDDIFVRDCTDGRLLADAPGKDPGLVVYDLRAGKVVSRPVPDWSGDWTTRMFLSRGGDFIVGVSLTRKYVPSSVSVEKERVDVGDGKLLVMDASSGKKLGEPELPEKTEAEFDAREEYRFMDFSADGKKMFFSSGRSVFAIDLPKAAVTQRIALPFAPGPGRYNGYTDWPHNSGFIVWP